MPSFTASPLGNPYKPGAGRSVEECLALYRRWLWARMREGGVVLAELERIASMAEAGDVWLACWCRKPGTNAPCHGDIVRAAVEWLQSPNSFSNKLTNSVTGKK